MELKSPHLAGCRSGWFRCLTDVKDPASPQAQLSSVKVAEAAPAPPPPSSSPWENSEDSFGSSFKKLEIHFDWI